MTYIVLQTLVRFAVSSHGTDMKHLFSTSARELLHLDTQTVAFFQLQSSGFHVDARIIAVSILLVRGKSQELRQQFSKNSSDESDLLSFAIQQFRKADHIISYRGNRYDLPFLKARAKYHGHPFPSELQHVDLAELAPSLLKGFAPGESLEKLSRILGLGEQPSFSNLAVFDWVRRWLKHEDQLALRSLLRTHKEVLESLPPIATLLLRKRELGTAHAA